jgi:hypothetical protein
MPSAYLALPPGEAAEGSTPQGDGGTRFALPKPR